MYYIVCAVFEEKWIVAKWGGDHREGLLVFDITCDPAISRSRGSCLIDGSQSL